MNITGLRIPTGGRQTSWLFTSMTEELNLGPPRNNSNLVVRAGLEPGTSGFQTRRPNHSATLPPFMFFLFFSSWHSFVFIIIKMQFANADIGNWCSSLFFTSFNFFFFFFIHHFYPHPRLSPTTVSHTRKERMIQLLDYSSAIP